MENLHAGHRQRMIPKLESGGLLPHEVLEVLLFYPTPRKNTNDLSHRLLAAFGSIEGVLNASMVELKRVRGVGNSLAAHLYCIGLICRDYIKGNQLTFQGKFNSQAFVPFVKTQYARVTWEVLDVYCVDSESQITKTYRFTDEEHDKVELDPADLTKIIMTEHPSGIVLVHNHPHGNADASQADDAMTKCAQLVCNMHHVLLCDHFIYAPNGVYSYYLSGGMQKISASYSVNEMTKGEKTLVEKGE